MPKSAPVWLAVLFCAGCEEEAILHPPAPPTTPVAALSPLKRLPASAPASEPTSQEVAKKPKKSMTLVAFMEDLIEPEAKKAAKAKGRSEALEAMLLQLPAMFPADDPKLEVKGSKKGWDAIIEASLKTTKYNQSCKQCHATWKKAYKKAYHDREVEVEAPEAE